MTLANKGTRKITVDAEYYRWVVSPDSGYLVLVVEHLTSAGQRIAVTIPSRDYWLDFKDLTHGKIEYDPKDYRPITPALVRKIILDALELGWSPQSAGKEIQLKLAPDDRLEARHS